jgi:hypothetical protein
VGLLFGQTPSFAEYAQFEFQLSFGFGFFARTIGTTSNHIC